MLQSCLVPLVRIDRVPGRQTWLQRSSFLDVDQFVARVSGIVHIQAIKFYRTFDA